MTIPEGQKNIMKQASESEIFLEIQQWSCVTFMRKFSWIDFVVPDNDDMMALLHVSVRLIKKDETSEFFKFFRNLKFKMKLGYECWRRNCILPELFREAIAQTIAEKEELAVDRLKRYIAKSKDFKKIERKGMRYRDIWDINRDKREKLATDLR